MPTRALVTSYEQDQRLFGDRWHTIGLSLLAILVVTYPFLAIDRWVTIANGAWIAIVGAVGMMILTGFAGQISLGHAAFLAIGAYTAAVTAEQFMLPFWLGIPAGGVLAALVGLAIGPFALRLRGLYLAIVTLGLVSLVNHTLMSLPELTHGASGIPVRMYGWFPTAAEAEAAAYGTFSQPSTLFGYEFTFPQKLYFVFAFLGIACTFACKNIQRSDTGRAMVAVRDHDLAAAVLGVNPARTKIVAFGLSSFFAGMAGAMFGYQQQFITIEPPFDLSMSVMYIAIIVIGGIGTTFGAVAGALVYVAVVPLAELVGRQIPLLQTMSSAQQSTLIFAVAVCAVLILEPLGILGLWLRIKRYFVGWPFRY